MYILFRSDTYPHLAPGIALPGTGAETDQTVTRPVHNLTSVLDLRRRLDSKVWV